MVEHRAERVDIGALVDGLAARLLGRHVRRRADHRADDRLVERRRGRASGNDVVGVAASLEILREAPVDHDGLAELADQHVRRLEVAMDDALAVRVRERIGDRDHVRQQREPLRERRRAPRSRLSSGRPATSFIA